MKAKSLSFVVLALLLVGCLDPTAMVNRTSVSRPLPPAIGPSNGGGYGNSRPTVPAPAYDGRKAIVAIAPLRGLSLVPNQYGGISLGPDINKTLASALMASGAFRVVSRERIRDIIGEQDLKSRGRVRLGTGPATGEITGADLEIEATITDFSADSSFGAAVGILGGVFGIPLAGVAGNITFSRMVLEVQVIDTRTSEIVLTTTVEGSSTDLGGGLGAFGGFSFGVGAWKGTPMEKTLRICLEKAVAELMNLPREYFRY